MSEYDVIIIGAGVGGLTSGALLAKKGLKVLILEKNHFVGGYCSSFKRKGFLFDACVHWFSSCGPGSFIDKIFKKIDLQMEFVQYDPMDCFHFLDRKIIVSNDINAYKRHLIALYPDEEAALDEFFTEMAAINSLFLTLLLNLEEKNDLGSAFQNREIFNATYQELLDKYFTHNSLKAILSAQWGFIGSPPGEASALIMMSMMHNYYSEGAFYPVGGAQSFSDQIARKIREYGGEIKINSEVTALDVRDDLVIGVRTKDGRRYKGKVIICNTDLKHLAAHLVKNDEEKWREFGRQLRLMKESMSMFILYLALDLPGEQLRDKIGWYYNDDLSLIEESPGSIGSYFTEGYLINIPSVLDPSLCPLGKSVMIVYTNIPEELYDKVEDWAGMKEQYERKCLDFIEQRVYRRIKEHVIFKIAATPKTLNRYTYNSKGAAYGWALTPEQLWEKRPSMESPLDNLYFTGHWTIPGGSVILTSISGWLANLKALNYLRNKT